MDPKTARVIKGYDTLQSSQQKEVREFIEKLEKASYSETQPLMESIQKSLGPVNPGICPCCGR